MTLAALGDSFTCGEGVGVRVPRHETWTALLARSLGTTCTSYAGPGARVRDVLRQQVPRVEKACVATVLVGLNDVARGGFDATALEADLREIVANLRRRAPLVLVGRLHDPTNVLWLPAPLRSVGQVRVARVNAMIDELEGVQVFDTGAVEAWRGSGAWDVDRVHPSRAGHAALARAAAVLLGDLGFPVTVGRPVPMPRGKSVPHRLLWGARHGIPYAAGHLRELSAPAWEGLRAASG